MKISWNQLNKLVDLNNITIIEVEEKLTLAGFEIENKTEIKEIEDIILEINITPNREDVIGFINIANELSALFKRPLTINNYLKKTYDNITIEKVNNSTELNLFSEICSCIIKNTKINFIEPNIINYLIAFGIKPTNSILDIINFINLKWGQDIVLYKLPIDYKINADQEIYKFKYSIQNKIDKKLEVKFNNKLLIQIDKNTIEQDDNTSNVILFNYRYNNYKNKVTEIQYTNNYYCIYAYKEILHILSSISKEIITPNLIYQYNKKSLKKNSITCTIEKINKILGPIKIKEKNSFLDNTTITETLQDLSFEIETNKKTIKIQVPNNRKNDISEEIDIVEEIGRIYGFNNFHDYLPLFNKRKRNATRTFLTQKIRRILRSSGLHEVINYSIKGKEDNNRLKIINPLNKDQQSMRQNIISNLVISKIYNTNQANESFEVFEIGNVFKDEFLLNQYTESLHLSCIFGNNQFNQSTWQENQSSLTWFQAKGQIEELFEKIESKASWSIDNKKNDFMKSFDSYIHPKNKIYIKHKNTTIGILSQINNRINKLIGKSYNIYFFEINIDELAKTIKPYNQLNQIYLPYSNYPKISRDFSIKINLNITMEEIQSIIENIKNQNSTLIESIILRNEYYNTKTIKTICLRITYRSQKKTLTNKEAEILDKMFKSKLYEEIMSKT